MKINKEDVTWVEVRDHDGANWCKRILLQTNKGKAYQYSCVGSIWKDKYLQGDCDLTEVICDWKYMRPLTPTPEMQYRPMTKFEIAKLIDSSPTLWVGSPEKDLISKFSSDSDHLSDKGVESIVEGERMVAPWNYYSYTLDYGKTWNKFETEV
jgi:hypothetical protein